VSSATSSRQAVWGWSDEHPPAAARLRPAHPEYAWQANQQGLGQFRPKSLSRELGTEVALALVDENLGTPSERAAAIGKRATLAQERSENREAQLEARFAALNPEFGVLPSRTDPHQHRFAHGRERALALGSRVHLAEARENTGSPGAGRLADPRACPAGYTAGATGAAPGRPGEGRGGTLTMPTCAAAPQPADGRRVPVDQRRLPAAPLREAITTYASRRQSLDELLGEGLERILRDAARTGMVTVAAGERCCDQLGWHPRMVWGDTYDRTIADDTPHTAAAPPGTTTAWRQGCRCLDCHDANRAATRRAKTARGGGHQRDPPNRHPATT
jgi:hypothetical protein